MTAGQFLERGRSLATRWWALPVLLVVVALVLGWRLEAGREAQAEAARLADEARLRAEGQLVVERSKTKDLEAEAKRLAARVPELEAELERARRAAPDARVVGTLSASTGARPAGGAPRVPAHPQAPAGVDSTTPTPPIIEGSGSPCLLAAGDEGEIRVDQVVLETRSGAQLLVGATSAWRLDPGPPTKILSGSFQSTLATAKSELQPAEPGWGAGVYVGLSRDGWAAGLALALPPARLLGLQAEVVIGAGVGSDGVWAGSGLALVR